MFNGAELRAFVDQATWVAVNDYEAQLLQERTGLDAAADRGDRARLHRDQGQSRAA